MLSPTNRLGGALQIASQVASIASGFSGLGLGFGASSAATTASAGLGGGLGMSPLLTQPVGVGGYFGLGIG